MEVGAAAGAGAAVGIGVVGVAGTRAVEVADIPGAAVVEAEGIAGRNTTSSH